jgi:hypothetical protein
MKRVMGVGTSEELGYQVTTTGAQQKLLKGLVTYERFLRKHFLQTIFFGWSKYVEGEKFVHIRNQREALLRTRRSKRL